MGAGKPFVAVCLTCKNAYATIAYALKSIALLKYPKDRLTFVIVDGGSNDDTVSMVKKIIDDYGFKHEIIIKPCNIPEGRNECIARAIEKGVDYILFLDSDTVIGDKQILSRMIECDVKYGPCVVSVGTVLRVFKSLKELEQFADSIVESDVSSNKLSVKVEAIPWCGMGLTLIPAEIARRVRFDEDMTFAEDAFYGYHVWRSGYKICSVTADLNLAYDVNLPKKSNIYVSMDVKGYLRGSYKKALATTYKFYCDSLFKTVGKFLKSKAGMRMLFHIGNTFALILGLIMLINHLTVLGLFFTMFYMINSSLSIARLRLTKCNNIRQASFSFIKFWLYSLYVLPLIPVIYLKHRSEFSEVFSRIESFKH
jgi:glycosyltransferase involved in cell wall biosynthesis